MKVSSLQPAIRRVAGGALAAGALLVVLQSPTLARDYYRQTPYVVAESNWGNGTVQGAVRHGRHGPQVRMPRGTWIDCVRSCSETLRRATVDFWESQGPQAKDTGPGYFKWDFRY